MERNSLEIIGAEGVIRRLDSSSRAREVVQNDKDKGRDERGYAGGGKIKKSKEIRKDLPTLTFSGG